MSCSVLEKPKTRDCVLPQFGRCQGVWWPVLPMGGHPQPQVCSANALSPSRHSLFWLRATLGSLNPGRTSGDQHSPRQKFRHSGQPAGHRRVIYLLTGGWWRVCDERHLGSSETRRGLGRQESVLVACPIRNEKRMIYHWPSLVLDFGFLFRGMFVWFCGFGGYFWCLFGLFLWGFFCCWFFFSC